MNSHLLSLYTSYSSSGEKFTKYQVNFFILCDHVPYSHDHTVLQSIAVTIKEKFDSLLVYNYLNLCSKTRGRLTMLRFLRIWFMENALNQEKNFLKVLNDECSTRFVVAVKSSWTFTILTFCKFRRYTFF